MATHVGVINASKYFIETDNESLVMSLYENLRYDEPEFKPNRFSKWDGKIRMFDKKSGVFPAGLLTAVLTEAAGYGIKPTVDQHIKDSIREVTLEAIQEWVDKLTLIGVTGDKIVPHDYQVKGLFYSIKFSRYTALAATSAGKSLMAYLMIRFWQEMNPGAAKIVLVVPTIQLTTQMFEDFGVYSSQDPSWNVADNCHVAGDGVSPYSRAPIVISTWQTLVNQTPDFFHQFNFLIGDEAHTFSSKSLEMIANNCINAHQRIGMSGSLRKGESDRLRVIQHFGSVQRLVKTKELQDRGIATKTMVHIMKLNHQSDFRVKLYNGYIPQKQLKPNQQSSINFNNEIEMLMACEARNKLIVDMMYALKGNSLFMFDRVGDHLMKVKELAEASGRNVFIIHGDVKPDERQNIKRALESGEDLVLLATYGTTSTGISIKKLHNLILCHPTKSIIRVIQTVGRMLRLHDSKDVANIFDLVDIAAYMGRNNYAMNHAFERIEIYREEEHPCRIVEINL